MDTEKFERFPKGVSSTRRGSGSAKTRFADSNEKLDAGQESQSTGGTITVDPDTEAPSLSKPTVTPRKLKPAGKRVQVSVNATDESEIVSVIARFTRGERILEVELEKTAAKSDKYSAAYELPRNRSRKTQVHHVQLVALDSAGNSATLAAGEVKVKAGPLSRVRQGS